MCAFLYTIGHSNLSVDRFVNLLRLGQVNTLCDVRSIPYSRYNPQFNRESLKTSLAALDIKYLYLGDVLGGRSKNPQHYRNSKLQYSLVASTPEFVNAIDRVFEVAQTHRVVLMCSESDPINCHRAILIYRHLRKRDVDLIHILGSGELEPQDEFERRLMEETKTPMQDLFMSHDELIERAYDKLGAKIAD